MRLCQLWQFVSGALPQAITVVSVVSLPSLAVFKPSGGWRGFHGILAMGRKYAGDRLPQLTQPRVDLRVPYPPRTNCEPARGNQSSGSLSPHKATWKKDDAHQL